MFSVLQCRYGTFPSLQWVALGCIVIENFFWRTSSPDWERECGRYLRMRLAAGKEDWSIFEV